MPLNVECHLSRGSRPRNIHLARMLEPCLKDPACLDHLLREELEGYIRDLESAFGAHHLLAYDRECAECVQSVQSVCRCLRGRARE